MRNGIHLFPLCTIFNGHRSSLTLVFVLASLIGCVGGQVGMIGVRVDTADGIVGLGSNGQVVLLPNKNVIVRLFGQSLDKVGAILVTTSNEQCGNPIEPVLHTGKFDLLSSSSVKFTFNFPMEQRDYYFCFNIEPDESNTGGRTSRLVHQGKHEWQYFSTSTKNQKDEEEHYLPFWLQVAVIALLLIFSGLFSGLNLGLMSLDSRELEIITKVGEKREREFAAKIYPIRRTGNYLLCTLLFGNVIVNSSISILFDDLTDGLIALVASSFGIVIFGEIVPQSVCSRYGLAVGAYTIFITRFFMVLTAPLSWPISKLLDLILGEEVGTIYNKEHLLELIRVSQEGQEILKDSQEVKIVTGALELSRKRVRNAMTDIRDVYMLPSETILDPVIVSEIVKSGYTRIPVYDAQDSSNIVAVLNVKDLALLDPDDKIPLTTICKFYQRPVRFVMEDTPLDVMLEEFKKGHYHMAMVQRINTDGDGDPTYDVVGLITLEDILEEIIQAEIIDEFDVFRINRRRPKGKVKVGALKDVTSFFYSQDGDAADLSSQLSLATYQYLSTTFDAFRADLISEQVLQRLIKRNAINTRPADIHESSKFLYQKGKECDYFVLILEGRATITIGEAGMTFEPGPFHYFGYEVIQSALQLMNQSDSPIADIVTASSLRKCIFTPDFTLEISRDLIYLKITASTYMKAYKATLVERQGGGGSSAMGSPPEPNAVTGEKGGETGTSGVSVAVRTPNSNRVSPNTDPDAIPLLPYQADGNDKV